MLVDSVLSVSFPLLFLGVIAVFIAGIVQIARRSKPLEWPNAHIGVGRVEKYYNQYFDDSHSYEWVSIQLSIEAENGTHFNAVLKRPLRRHHFYRLQEGMLIPVMFRPERPDDVRIAQGDHQYRAQLFLNQVRIRDGILDEASVEADLRGYPAYARIEWVRPTGRDFRGLKEWQLGLTVFPPVGQPFPVSKTQTLLDFEMESAKPGRIVPIRILPNSPNAIAVSLRPK